MPFKLNSQVEKFLVEEPSVSYSNVFNDEQLAELKNVALDFLQVKQENFPLHRNFWLRKGGIHQVEYIKNFSNTFLKKYLPKQDVELIGDTAFVLNYPPHDIHIDCRDFRADPAHKGIVAYKSVVIPVEITANEYPTFYTSNQYFYGPTTRFRAGSEEKDATDPEVQRQKDGKILFSYDYTNDGMKYCTDTILPKEWYDEKIDAPDYTPYSNFKGISIEKEHAWKPGDLIVFDSARLHFAQNIKKCGAKFKIGISLNYGIRVDI